MTPPFQHHSPTTMPPSVMVNMSGNREGSDGDITAIIFKTEEGDDLEVSVIIEDVLSSNSLMELVMVEGEVYCDLGVPACNIKDYKFLIQKQSGSKLTLKWDKFRKLTVDTFIRIKNIDNDYVITLKDTTLKDTKL